MCFAPAIVMDCVPLMASNRNTTECGALNKVFFLYSSLDDEGTNLRQQKLDRQVSSLYALSAPLLVSAAGNINYKCSFIRAVSFLHSVTVTQMSSSGLLSSSRLLMKGWARCMKEAEEGLPHGASREASCSSATLNEKKQQQSKQTNKQCFLDMFLWSWMAADAKRVPNLSCFALRSVRDSLRGRVTHKKVCCSNH